MKVLCTSIISPVSGEPLESSTWVHIGGEYLVLGIEAVVRERIRLQIVTDEGTPSWWDSRMFATTDPRIPPDWEAAVNEKGHVTLCPTRWAAPGFWERYFDQEPEAKVEYAEELSKIEVFHGAASQ